MAITTYAELQTAMNNWLDRTDLSSFTPNFIALCEADINRRLRVRQQITSTTLTPVDGSATLPTDYLEWKRVTWTGDPRRSLEYVTPEYLQSYNAAQESGQPNYFTIEGETLKVAPIHDTSLEFLYAQKVPPLATTDPNWLLTAHPDIYLFGSLTMAATFTSDAENGSAWKALYDQYLDGMWRLNFVATGTQAQRAVGPTP